MSSQTVYVHRWVVAQIDGWDAIESKVVMHLCDRPSCFRYDHLRIGTRKENMQDMVDKGRFNMGTRVPAQHGSLKKYSAHKCRCDECRGTWNDYQRENMRKRRAAQ